MKECCGVEHAIVFIVALLVYIAIAFAGYRVVKYEIDVKAYELNVLVDVEYYRVGLIEILLNNPYTTELCIQAITIYDAGGGIVYNVSVNQCIPEKDTIVYVYPLKLDSGEYIIEIFLNVYGYKYTVKKPVCIRNMD